MVNFTLASTPLNAPRINSKARERKRRLVESFGGKCLDCGSTRGLTIDHIIPLSLGGTSFLDNKQILCESCNTKKDNLAIDFRSKELRRAVRRKMVMLMLYRVSKKRHASTIVIT